MTIYGYIAIIGAVIITLVFLLAICKANGNTRDDDEQERYLKEKLNKSN